MKALPCLVRAGLVASLLLTAIPGFAQDSQDGKSSTSGTSSGGGDVVASPMCLDCGPPEINLPPTVSLTSPTNGQTFITGASVTLAANASDSDGSVMSVVFTIDGVAVGTDTTDPYSLSWTATSGSHAVRAKATDDGGKSITTSPVTITVSGPATPPSETPLPPVAGSVSRTEVVTYYDDESTQWVLGQTATVTCTASIPASTACDGDVVSATTYDPVTALPLTTSRFGKPQSTMTYNANGTLATVKDGLNHTTTFSNWKRGIPQAIQAADLTSQSAEVNDSGWIMSVTDELGNKTCYGYDAMGRISSITYPSETQANVCDTSKWTATLQSFVPVASAEYGIAAGHWRQTVSTGNAVKITYVDALWRPVLVREYDAGNIAATERFTKTAYDADGRVGFASYPMTGVTNAAQQTGDKGVTTFYDPLGRVTSVAQDSELGLLVTLTDYLTGFQTRVTNPRGFKTISSYLAYDQPGTDWPLVINAPESATTTISRDPHGKPLSLTRSGGGATPVVRTYAYNGYQELCRSEEPETGTTLFAYDAAGNLASSAAGLAIGTACGTANSRTVSRTYDTRNRLSTLSFPDGNGNQGWTYYADGLPLQVTTSNGGNTVTNSYTYNKRRLLTGESLTPDTLLPARSIGYGYNALGQVVTETQPDNVLVGYTVNALGQVIQVTTQLDGGAVQTSASNASYYPNGALKQFTYGNGIVHAMTQNARQLPSRSTDGTVLDLGTTFDANGNVAGVTDYTASARQTKTMAYDGLDRLTGTTSPMFGTATYAYDAIDNLKQVGITGGSQPRTHYYCYNANNQLDFVRSGVVCGGTPSPAVIALAYDAQGNLANKNGTAYAFDYDNRLRSTANLTYRYDADGRRVRLDNAGAQLRYSQYAKDGRLVWQRDEPGNKRTANIYFAGSLVAEYSRPLATNTVTASYFHTDALGSPIAKTNSSGTIIETSEYEPFGKLLNRANDDKAGYTGHVMDSASGLTYMQQRYFDPMIGRFLSRDPVTADPNSGANFNAYWYANNNPYSFTDPDGRVPDDARERLNQASDSFNSIGGVASDTSYSNGVPTIDVGTNKCIANCSSPPSSYGLGDLKNDVEDIADEIWNRILPAIPIEGQFLTVGKFAAASLLAVRVRTGAQGFESFAAFKRAMGPAGSSMHWHHIVEQTGGNVSRFGATSIHNVQNLVRLDAGVHRKISGFYSSIQPQVTGSTTLTVRQWMSAQSFRAQQEFGQRVLQQFSN